MMNTDELILKHFPFKKFNPGQKEAIESAISAIKLGKKHILMELPTGIGKSAIATTVHRVLRSMDAGYRSTIVTATKGLQDQYMMDDPVIVNIMGKQNYGCPKGAKQYGSTECKVLTSCGKCVKDEACPYFKARETWRFEAPLRLTNTSFAIKAPIGLIGDRAEGSRANLTIIDECHEIDEQLVSHATISIIIDDIKMHEKYIGAVMMAKFAAVVNLFLDFDNGQCLIPSAELRKDVNDFVEELQKRVAIIKDNKQAGDAVEMMESFAEELSDFANSNGEWIVDAFSFATKLVLSPVYAHQVVDRGLYDKADTFIHMSATICGFDEYMKTMGIDKATAHIITAPNPIPLDQRPILALNVMAVSKGYDVTKLATFVDKIIERHPDQSGVVHTVSFQLAKDLKENSKHKRRMLISNQKDEILSFLKKPGSIVLSPSIEAGYDFKGDLARWQIVAKVPFEFLGSPWIKLNMQRSGKWYSRKAIVRVVQASGRAVRGVDDYATTYILDSNFERLYKTNQELFPDWYKDAVHMK